MATDRYRLELECSVCGSTGEANIRENDGWSFMRDRGRHVEGISQGFVVVDHGSTHGSETIINCGCGARASTALPSRRGNS